MTQLLDTNSEYLVATDLSGSDLARKIVELEEMRLLIENATPRPMAERWQRYLQRQHNDLKYHATFFVVSPELHVQARVYEPHSDYRPWSLSLAIIDGPVSEFHPLTLRGSEERARFDDHTMQGLENDVPTMSKDRALAAIDRWIGLLISPLPQTAPDQPPAAAVGCARDFIGSVAALAKKLGVADYVLPSLEEDPVNQELKVSAEFPTARLLPQVSFTGWRNDDCSHEYEYLTREAAAIYACALPTVISVAKTYSTGTSEDRSREPFGLQFQNWRSPNLLFEPSAAMAPILSHLPGMPVDAIIPPIYSED